MVKNYFEISEAIQDNCSRCDKNCEDKKCGLNPYRWPSIAKTSIRKIVLGLIEEKKNRDTTNRFRPSNVCLSTFTQERR